MEPKTLLDTDVLSGLMRKNPTALNRAPSYLADHRQFAISLVTRFEILRRLKAKQGESEQPVRLLPCIRETKHYRPPIPIQNRPNVGGARQATPSWCLRRCPSRLVRERALS